MELEIIYRDDHLVAINKPHGLLVHRTKLAADADIFALQLLRDQLGQQVYPAHRLDRKTGGVLIFSLSEEVNRWMQNMFANHSIEKIYHAIVRGHLPPSGVIDYPLKRDDGVLQEASTKFNTLQLAEINIPFGKHKTSRYSLVEINPETGRMHQIRKHFAHILHPIIGDRPHGCNKQNKLFKENWNMITMLLHASKITFKHPLTFEEIILQARLHSEFRRMLHMIFGEDSLLIQTALFSLSK